MKEEEQWQSKSQKVNDYDHNNPKIVQLTVSQSVILSITRVLIVTVQYIRSQSWKVNLNCKPI